MFRLVYGLTTLTLFVTATVTEAQVFVQTPGVRVEVGRPPVILPSPLPVPGRPVSPGNPPAVPYEESPVPSAPPVIVAPPIRKMYVPTPEQFLASRPTFAPGRYEVTLLHPCTKCPVKVCFRLPVCPRRVYLRGMNMEFRWGLFKCKAVIVSFMPNGTVLVRD